MTDKQIIFYTTEDNKNPVTVTLTDDTVWLTQKQIASLFGKNIRTISEHILNIFEDELDENSVVRNFRITAEDGKNYETNHYNLDLIISVGYRVKSPQGIRFRRWANKILKEYIIKGYALNEKRLQQAGLHQLRDAVLMIENLSKNNELSSQQTSGLLDIITNYTKTWTQLYEYDKNQLTEPKGQKDSATLEYKNALDLILAFKNQLVVVEQASGLFGNERDGAFQGILKTIYQSFGGSELYATIESKASHLLYFIIKDHPFSDGNKRIGSLMFIEFLRLNYYEYKGSGELKVNDNTLTALALLVASSDPKQKELMVTLIMQLLQS
jgi:prophage maintenance system killer protein